MKGFSGLLEKGFVLWRRALKYMPPGLVNPARAATVVIVPIVIH